MHQMEMQKLMMMMMGQGAGSSEPVAGISQSSPSKRLKSMPSDPCRGEVHLHASTIAGSADRASQEHEYYGDKVISVYRSYENMSQSLLQCQGDQQTQEIPHPEFPHLFVHRIVARFMFLHCLNTNWSLGQLTGLQHNTLFGQRAGQNLFAATGRIKNAQELEGLLKERQQRYIPSHKYIEHIQYLEGPRLETASVHFAEYLQTTVSKHIAKHIAVTDSIAKL